jgi:hypothetical protein
MWTQYRWWKSWVGVGLMILGYSLIQLEPEGSARWKAGIILVASLGIAYVVEEVVWMAKRQGRPCGHCGQKVQMKAFHVLTTCPHCAQTLE